MKPIIDINELKTDWLKRQNSSNENIAVFLEKIEDKNGEVVVSAIKAQKIKGWYKLEKAYEDNENNNWKNCFKMQGWSYR